MGDVIETSRQRKLVVETTRGRTRGSRAETCAKVVYNRQKTRYATHRAIVRVYRLTMSSAANSSYSIASKHWPPSSCAAKLRCNRACTFRWHLSAAVTQVLVTKAFFHLVLNDQEKALLEQMSAAPLLYASVERQGSKHCGCSVRLSL